MLTQMQGGMVFYSVGASWFKLPANASRQTIDTRLAQIRQYSQGSDIVAQALYVCATEGQFKTIDRGLASLVESVLKNMRASGITPIRGGN